MTVNKGAAAGQIFYPFAGILSHLYIFSSIANQH